MTEKEYTRLSEDEQNSDVSSEPVPTAEDQKPSSVPEVNPSPSEDSRAAEARAVYVTGISPKADMKTVSDFFSFCGKIVALSFTEGDSVCSILFVDEPAAKTALLLSNALLVDGAITVVPFKVDVHGELPSVQAKPGQGAAKGEDADDPLPEPLQKVQSALMTFKDKSVELGETIKQKVDGDGAMEAKFNEVLGNVHAKANEWEGVMDEKAHKAVDAVKGVIDSAAENETVKEGIQFMANVGKSMSQSFSSWTGIQFGNSDDANATAEEKTTILPNATTPAQ